MAIKSLAFKIFLTGVIAVLLVSAGREVLYPVATVILGGLVGSTLLDCLKNFTAFESVEGNRRNALTRRVAAMVLMTTITVCRLQVSSRLLRETNTLVP